MPRDVAGNYTLPAGNPVVTATIIASTWANTTLSDLATAMTNSLDRTGSSAGMTGQFKAVAGNVGAPGISWGLEPTSGFYRQAAGNFRYSVGGVDVFIMTGTGLTIPAPGSGDALTVNAVASGRGIVIAGATSADALAITAATGGRGIFVTGASGATCAAFVAGAVTADTINISSLAAGQGSILIQGNNANAARIGCSGAANQILNGSVAGDLCIHQLSTGTLRIGSNTVVAITLDSNQQVTMQSATGAFNSLNVNAGGTDAPAVGTGRAATFRGKANAYTVDIFGSATASQSFGINLAAGTNASDNTLNITTQGGSTLARLTGDGQFCVIPPPSLSLQNSGFFNVGYLDSPANTQNANYTLVFTDRGKTICRTGGVGPFTWTIPANVFSAGSILNLFGAPGVTGVTTIAQGASLTLTWIPNNSTGNRTGATSSFVATIYYISATLAYIWGSGIS